METNLPLVTVYIPTYNRVELLKRAVKSVQDQTYQNLEIIIVDDCSTDGTHEYLAQLAKEDSRVRYFLKEKNSGACVSRNIAIENATGEFITGLDDDDFFLENRIQSFVKNINLLDKHEFMYSLYKYKIIQGEICVNKSEKYKPRVIKAEDLISINYINNQIFTKTDRLRKSKFNESLPAWQDIFTWYLLLSKNKKTAILIKEISYVMDISHEHERISNKKIEKIIEAYNFFVKNHKLNYFQRKILKIQLMNYDKKYRNRIGILLSLFYSFNLYSIIVFKNRLFS